MMKNIGMIIICFVTTTLYSQDLLTVVGNFDIKSSAVVYVKGGILGTGSGQITNNGDIYIQQHTTSGSENWTNNASETFLNGTGTEIFNSSEPQYITGSYKTTFYNLTVDNSGTGVIMGQDADVINNLTMTNGELDLQNSIIDLGPTGTILTETETNRIKVGDVMANTGTIQTTKTVNNVTNYNPANIGVEITTTQNLGVITIVRGHQRQQGTGTYTANYSIARYIDIPDIGEIDGTDINAELYYWEAELDPVDHPSEAGLIQYHNVTQSGNTWWTPLSGVINTTINLSTPISNPYDASIYGAGYSSVVFNDRFTLSSDKAPLPVELLYFDAQWKDNSYKSVKLEWETVSEINNDYFVVERSLNLVNFTPIMTIDGNGSTNQVISYQEFDDNPVIETISYYRLKQVDFNGDYTYSDIKCLYPPRDFIEIISIYPNPADNEITFQVVSSLDKKIYIYVIDDLGRKIISVKNYVHKGLNTFKLNVSSLSGATYILHIITTDGMHKTQKEFIKK